MQVTNEQIKQWLDMQIGANRAMECQILISKKTRLSNLSKQNYIHISNEGLRYIARRLNLKLFVKVDENCKDYPYELWFWYKGVRFIAIEPKKVYEKLGAVE